MAIILPKRGYPALDTAANMFENMRAQYQEEQAKVRLATQLEKIKQQQQTQRSIAMAHALGLIGPQGQTTARSIAGLDERPQEPVTQAQQQTVGSPGALPGSIAGLAGISPESLGVLDEKDLIAIQKAQQEERKIGLDREALEEKKQQDPRKFAATINKQTQKANRLMDTTKRLEKSWQKAKEKWPRAAERWTKGGLSALFGGAIDPEDMTQDPDVREYLRVLNEAVRDFYNYSADSGRQSVALLKLTQRGKAGTLTPPEVHESMIEEFKDIAGKDIKAQRYMKSLMDPATGKYPVNLGDMVTSYMADMQEESAQRPDTGEPQEQKEPPAIRPDTIEPQDRNEPPKQGPDATELQDRNEPLDFKPDTDRTGVTTQEAVDLVQDPDNRTHIEKFLGRKLPQRPITPEEKAEVKRALDDMQEILLPIANDIGSILSLPFTALFGMPGDIQEAVIRPAMGLAGYATKAATLGYWNTPFFQDIVDKYPWIKMPTSRELNELLRDGKPVTKTGSMLNDFGRDIVSVYGLVSLGTGSLGSFIRASGIGKLAKYSLDSLGFDSSVAEAGDALGTLLGSSWPTKGYFKKMGASLYNKAEELFEKGTTAIPTNKVVGAAREKLRRLLTGSMSKSEEKTARMYTQLLQSDEFQKGWYLPRQLKNLNELSREVDPKTHEKYIKPVVDVVWEELRQYAKRGPENKMAVDTLKRASEFYKTGAAAETTVSLLGKLINTSTASKVSPQTLLLLGLTNIVGKKGLAATAAGGMSAATLMNMYKRLSNPEINKTYLKMLGALYAGNSKNVNRHLLKLDSDLKR